jgi:hypothetical protein
VSHSTLKEPPLLAAQYRRDRHGSASSSVIADSSLMITRLPSKWKHAQARPDTAEPGADRPGLARYKALMSWMVAAAVIAVLLAILYLKLSGLTLQIHMVIATMAGVFLLSAARHRPDGSCLFQQPQRP